MSSVATFQGLPAAPAPLSESVPCFHCGLALDPKAPVEARFDGRTVPVCCHGCAAAVAFVADAGLEDYYRLRTRPTGIAAGSGATPRADSASAAAEPLDDGYPGVHSDDYSDDYAVAEIAARFTVPCANGLRVELAIGGMHCAACAWLLEQGLGRETGVHRVSVELVAGRAQVEFDPQRTDLARLLARVRGLGFEGTPARHDGHTRLRERERRRSLRALGISGVVAMQVMMLAVADYAGLLGNGMDTGYRALLLWAQLVLASVAVFAAAGTFFRGAARALRAGRLTMDVPVAIAVTLAYGASILLMFSGGVGSGAHLYFDSVSMFVFFLLLGRHLELTVRQRLARGDDGLRELLPAVAHRVEGTGTRAVAADLLQRGDRLRVGPGEHLAADARVVGGRGHVDRALLTGESVAVPVEAESVLDAGVRVLDAVLDVEVLAPPSASTVAGLPGLLDRARARRPRAVQLADRLASRFLAAVLLLAVGAGLLWWWIDPSRVLEVVLATLIVTCPCALSLATPTALSAAATRLARAGIVVARPDALETLALCEEVCFDKTGTLTEPLAMTLRLRDGDRSAPAIAAALERDVDHPIAHGLARVSSPFRASGVRAVAGHGVEGTVLGRRWRLGRGTFVGLPQDDDDVHLAPLDGGVGAARFTRSEPLREGAADAVSTLRALGLVPTLLSGDATCRTQAVAERFAIERWQAERDPAGKLDWLRGRMHGDRHVAYVGDGINDAPVLAGASAAIAVGSASAFARDAADVVLLSRGLDALPELIGIARATRARIRMNLAWAVAYNVCAVPLALAGLVTPWLAALGMSASSLLVTAGSARLLREEAA